MIEIPPAVDIFILCLVGVQPSPESIWSIGSRANGGATNESNWDFVVFADTTYFDMRKTGSPPAELAVDVLVVVDALMCFWRIRCATNVHPYPRALNRAAQKSRTRIAAEPNSTIQLIGSSSRPYGAPVATAFPPGWA